MLEISSVYLPACGILVKIDFTLLLRYGEYISVIHECNIQVQ